MIVIPNLCGICVWSPPLDEHGNSVRGVDFSTRMVEKFNFHIFDTIRSEKNSKKLDPRINPNEQRNIAMRIFYIKIQTYFSLKIYTS